MEINHDTGKVTVTNLADHSSFLGVYTVHDDPSTMHSIVKSEIRGTYSINFYGTVANKITAKSGLKIDYNFSMHVDSADRVTVTGKTTNYPAMELWEYTSAGAKKLYSYSAAGYGVFEGLKTHRLVDVVPAR
jgi:hypothetical protein